MLFRSPRGTIFIVGFRSRRSHGDENRSEERRVGKDVRPGVDLGGRRIIKKIFFKQKTAYEIMSRDWSSDVCSSDLAAMSAPAEELTAEARAAGTPVAGCLPAEGTSPGTAEDGRRWRRAEPRRRRSRGSPAGAARTAAVAAAARTRIFGRVHPRQESL